MHKDSHNQARFEYCYAKGHPDIQCTKVILGNSDCDAGENQQADPDNREGFLWDYMCCVLFRHNYLGNQ